MAIMLDALFAPFAIKNLRLKNRLVLAPMSRYQNEGGIPDAALAKFYAERAPDLGLVMTGAVAVDLPAANNHPKLANINAGSSAGWQQVVEAVHNAGSPISMQLWHAGPLFNVAPDYQPAPIKSPSGLVTPGRKVGEPMSETDIADCIDAFATAAKLAKDLGFDAIEVHAGHGFLLDAFFWKGINQREDGWGGLVLPARARFALEVVKAVRKAVGDEMLVSLRVSQWKEQDYTVKLAASPLELEQWLVPFVEAGIDMISCSQRRFWEPEFKGSELNFAGWVRKVTGAPTITVGSVGLSTDVMTFFEGAIPEHRPLDELMRRLDADEFDLVAVGRALLADPDWVRKVRENRIMDLKQPDPKAIMQWI